MGVRLVDLTPESPCPRVADGYELCGLLWQHPGPCVPFVPGDYLAPLLLHPLDLGTALADRWHMLCPMCWRRVTDWDAPLSTVSRGGSINWDRPSVEYEFTFQPCGCVGRVILVGD